MNIDRMEASAASTARTEPGVARDGSADLLRAVLVVYVVGYLHLGGYIGSGDLHVHWSTVAVTNVVLGTFTFLSGYMLGIWVGPFDIRGLTRFYKRRFLRIYPLYLLALGAFVMVWLTDPLSALKAALGLSMFLPPAPMTLWYVAMIVVCYALAPLLVMPAVGRAVTYWALAWSLMLAYGFVVVEMDHRILTQFAAFAGGVMCRRLGWRERCRHRTLPLASSFALTLLAAVMSLGYPMLGAVVAVPSVVLGPLLLMVFADRSRFAGEPGALVRSLAYVSFSAYLFHRVFFELLKRVIWPADPLLQLVVLIVLGLPLIWVGSAVLQWSYDRLLLLWRIR